MNSPRVLTVDIESVPIEAYTWGIWDVNVGLEQIKTDWSILSYAAKWLDSPEIYYADTMGRGPKKVRDDKPLMRGLWELLDKADIVVGQNINSFDIKKINARLITHGFGPYSPVRTVDTMRVAKKHFSFTSNKLAFLSQNLTDAKKSEHRAFPGFSLWLECLADNPKARKELKKYNIQDVVTTEQLYKKQLPWISGHPNLATYSMREDVTCPKCASPKLQARGFATTQTGKFQRLQCQACGGWSRAKLNLTSKDKRSALLVSQ